jgi:hypothetical protein
LRSSVTKPIPYRIASHAVDLDWPALDQDLSSLDRVSTENRARQLGAAGTDQARQADHLASPHDQAYAAQAAPGPNVSHFQSRRT